MADVRRKFFLTTAIFRGKDGLSAGKLNL